MRAERFLRRIERKLVGALTFTSEAFDFALEGGLELDDIDGAVVIDQIDLAGRHGMGVLRIVRPDLAAATPESVAATLAQSVKRYRIRLDCCCTNRTDHFAGLVCAALDACLGAHAIARWGQRRSEVADAIAELEGAASHFENILYLLDPQMFRRAIESGSPDDRIRLAAAEEAAELEIDQNRKLVRGRAGTRRTH